MMASRAFSYFWVESTVLHDKNRMSREMWRPMLQTHQLTILTF